EKSIVLPQPVEPPRTQLGEHQRWYLAGLVFYRKQDQKAFPLRRYEHLLRDLIDRVFLDASPANRAERPPRARPKQAHEVVNLSRSRDGRSRIARGVLLADGNGRRN